MVESADTPARIEARLHVSAEEHGVTREFPRGLPTGEGGAFLIGRGRSADLTLHDKYVSEEHAKIVVRNGRHVVVDLESTGGTRVNGEQIREDRKLNSGDVITVGHSTCEYRCFRRTDASRVLLDAPKPKKKSRPSRDAPPETPAETPQTPLEPTAANPGSPAPAAPEAPDAAPSAEVPEIGPPADRPDAPELTPAPVEPENVPLPRSRGRNGLAIALGVATIVVVIGLLVYLFIQAFVSPPPAP